MRNNRLFFFFIRRGLASKIVARHMPLLPTGGRATSRGGNARSVTSPFGPLPREIAITYNMDVDRPRGFRFDNFPNRKWTSPAHITCVTAYIIITRDRISMQSTLFLGYCRKWIFGFDFLYIYKFFEVVYRYCPSVFCDREGGMGVICPTWDDRIRTIADESFQFYYYLTSLNTNIQVYLN